MHRPHVRPGALLSVLLILSAAWGALPERGGAQGVEGYFRAVGEHFGVSVDEVLVLAEWGLPPDEIPVVVFLSQRGGISPDALVALKRGGRSWGELASRYGLDAGAFHVPLPEGGAGAGLARAYQQYGSRSARSWSEIRLQDQEIVRLVNVRFLSEHLRLPASRVVEASERHGSFVAAFHALARGGGR